jgi:hypothetical protein
MQSVGRGLLFFLTFGVAGYVLFAYGLMPLGALVHPDMKSSFLAIVAWLCWVPNIVLAEWRFNAGNPDQAA